jgi:aryl-alcohol dehydrogenase-like predicted oxidoreductase
LPVLREQKKAGRFRYLGVTTSNDEQYDALLAIMRKETLDFIQVDYSVGDRGAADKILPLAADRGNGRSSSIGRWAARAAACWRR